MSKSLSIIKKYNSNLSMKQIDKIRYGLEGTYLTLSKFLIISLIAIALGIFKEFLIFTIFYNVIRLFAFGLHATNSLICLITSSLIFIVAPILATKVTIILSIKILLSLLSLILIVLYAPADTYKRPLINKKKRRRLKVASIIVTSLYISLILFIKINFISNVVLFALLTEVILILPITYKTFKLPYKNYATFVRHSN